MVRRLSACWNDQATAVNAMVHMHRLQLTALELVGKFSSLACFYALISLHSNSCESPPVHVYTGPDAPRLVVCGF